MSIDGGMQAANNWPPLWLARKREQCVSGPFSRSADPQLTELLARQRSVLTNLRSIQVRSSAEWRSKLFFICTTQRCWDACRASRGTAEYDQFPKLIEAGTGGDRRLTTWARRPSVPKST